MRLFLPLFQCFVATICFSLNMCIVFTILRTFIYIAGRRLYKTRRHLQSPQQETITSAQLDLVYINSFSLFYIFAVFILRPHCFLLVFFFPTFICIQQKGKNKREKRLYIYIYAPQRCTSVCESVYMYISICVCIAGRLRKTAGRPGHRERETRSWPSKNNSLT